MPKIAPPRQRAATPSRKFAIVASQFNAYYVDGLIDHARKELHALDPRVAVTLQRVPGAFEIPIVVHELASKKNVEAIIALGVILQGETSHAENLTRSVTDALQRIALDHGVPVIHAVLSFANEDQARERCLASHINRGTEAARTAVEIASTLAKLRA
jgi:6,7-dimethyl-8-ribityllumazine synthase